MVSKVQVGTNRQTDRFANLSYSRRVRDHVCNLALEKLPKYLCDKTTATTARYQKYFFSDNSILFTKFY